MPQIHHLDKSVATDLKISETVDEPNWLVSACMPLGIFGGDG